MIRHGVILADTSAWVEFLRGTGSDVDRRMTELVAEPHQLAITEPVILEVTSGARADAQEVALRRLLARCVLLAFASPTDFDGATGIYRRCRRVGVTPRGLIDCMIAAVARRHDATVLAHDVDLARIAPVAEIDLDPTSLRA